MFQLCLWQPCLIFISSLQRSNELFFNEIGVVLLKHGKMTSVYGSFCYVTFLKVIGILKNLVYIVLVFLIRSLVQVYINLVLKV